MSWVAASRTSATPDAAAMAAALGCCVARGRLVTSSSSAAAMDSGDLPSHGCKWPPIGLLARHASSAGTAVLRHVPHQSFYPAQCLRRPLAACARVAKAEGCHPRLSFQTLDGACTGATMCGPRRTCKAAGCHAAAWLDRWQDRWHQSSTYACMSFTTRAKRGAAAISAPAPAQRSSLSTAS